MKIRDWSTLVRLADFNDDYLQCGAPKPNEPDFPVPSLSRGQPLELPMSRREFVGAIGLPGMSSCQQVCTGIKEDLQAVDGKLAPVFGHSVRGNMPRSSES